MESSVAFPRGRPPLTTSGRAAGLSLGWAWAGVGLLTIVALVLRLVLMGDSLQDDELFMYAIVHNTSLGDALSIVKHTEKTPPLFFVLNWFTIRIGDPTIWMRLPSLLCGVASVPLAFVLGERVVNRRTGLVAAALVALSPFAIYYATNARAYAGLAFFAALSTYCLLQAVDGHRRGWWAAYGLAVVAVLYTHYAGIFVLVAQALWAIVAHREQWREWVVVHVLVVLAYVPWIPGFLVQHGHSGDEAQRIARLTPPTLQRFVEYDFRVVLGNPGIAPRDIPGTIPAIIALAVIAAALVAALVRVWQARGRDIRLSSPLTLAVLVAVISPIGVALASVRPDRSFLLPRNMSASLLALEIVVAWLLLSAGRRIGVAAAVVVLVVMGIGAGRSMERPFRKAQYRAAAQYIEADGKPGDPVLERFVYAPQGAQAQVLRLNFSSPRLIVAPQADESQAWAAGRRGAGVWFVEQLPGIFAKVKHLPPRAGPGNAFTLVREHRYEGVIDLLVGEYRAAP